MKYLIICFLFISSLAFADEVKVQVRFTEQVDVKGQEMSYSDALYYPIEDWPVKQEDIDKVKSERVQNWKSIIENPAPVVEPTKEDMVKEEASIDEQLVTLQARKVELTTRINAKTLTDTDILPISE